MKNILISDVMTRDPVTAKPEITLLQAAKLMIKKKVGSLLLTNKKRLVGIISRRDILWALIKKSKEDLGKIQAVEISPKKIATTKPTATIKEAIKKMKKFKFEKLPVIHEKELVGMVTIRDILNFAPGLYPELDEFAAIREESKKLKRVKKAKNRDFMHEGICEECGNQDILYRIDGVLMCESCKNSM